MRSGAMLRRRMADAKQVVRFREIFPCIDSASIGQLWPRQNLIFLFRGDLIAVGPNLRIAK